LIVMKATRARRQVVVVDNTELAKAIGGRIRHARLRAGLTQRELAGDRYTSAYISALETGGAKPSMASLRFLSERLGVPVRNLIGEEPAQWKSLEADLRLAAGDWQTAADAYRALLDRGPSPSERRQILLGLAEALCRLDHGRDALPLATEARQLAQQQRDSVAAAVAGYWMAAAHSQLDNPSEARSLLTEALASIRSGLRVTSDFQLRVLVAIAVVESQDEEHERALAYLEEARGLSAEMDDLRRARYLFNLAVEYQETGDYEASLRAASQSAALFRAAESDRELAALENTSALTFLKMGNPTKARQSFKRAMGLVGGRTDDRFAAHLAETQARIAVEEGDWDEATSAIARAIDLARQTGNGRTLATSLATQARIQQGRGDAAGAASSYAAAADAARAHGGRGILRQVLGQWADYLTNSGQLEEATKLYREALNPGQA
jgi:transcriptional regulator with XRE-family HTH domain